MGGSVAAVLLIVQYIKAPLDTIWKIPTRVIVYVLSLGILLAADGFAGGFEVQSVVIDVLNAFIVALAAMGSYEATFAKKDAKVVEEYAGEDK
jgi:hypothetical protein